MQDGLPLPSLKDAVGAEAYEHRPQYNIPIRTISLEAPAWNAAHWSAHPNNGQQPRGACAPSIHPVNTNAGLHSPHLDAGPYSRNPSLSTSSVNLSAPESVDGYCTSPATTSCSSDTFGTSSTRKRTPAKKSRGDRQSQNPIKNRKEKKHRTELTGCIREHEDIQVIYVGTFVGSSQMTGNKKSSGLLHCKQDTLGNSSALLLHLADKEYRRHLINGTVPQFREELVRCIKEYREPTNPERDPAYNTLMRGIGAPCTGGDNGICAQHGKQDWAVCRTRQVEEAFNREQEMFLREHALDSKKRRMA